MTVLNIADTTIKRGFAEVVITKTDPFGFPLAPETRKVVKVTEQTDLLKDGSAQVQWITRALSTGSEQQYSSWSRPGEELRPLISPHRTGVVRYLKPVQSFPSQEKIREVVTDALPETLSKVKAIQDLVLGYIDYLEPLPDSDTEATSQSSQGSAAAASQPLTEPASQSQSQEEAPSQSSEHESKTEHRSSQIDGVGPRKRRLDQ